MQLLDLDSRFTTWEKTISTDLSEECVVLDMLHVHGAYSLAVWRFVAFYNQADDDGRASRRRTATEIAQQYLTDDFFKPRLG